MFIKFQNMAKKFEGKRNDFERDRREFERLCNLAVSRKQSEVAEKILPEINRLANLYRWDLGKAMTEARNRVPSELGGRKGRR
jgi:hypothetical protein